MTSASFLMNSNKPNVLISETFLSGVYQFPNEISKSREKHVCIHKICWLIEGLEISKTKIGQSWDVTEV